MAKFSKLNWVRKNSTTALHSLAEAAASNFEAGLKTAELSHEGMHRGTQAPRRLALKVTALAEGQADKVVEKRGPAIFCGIRCTEGNATKAAQGWARGNGITVGWLTAKTDKGEWLLFKQRSSWQTCSRIGDGHRCEKALAGLPILKQCAGVTQTFNLSVQ